MSDNVLSISKIAELTGKDRRTVVKRLSALKPVDTLKGAKLYDSYQALTLVLLPDMEEVIKNKITAESPPEHAGGYDGTVDDNRIKRAKAEKLEMELAEKRGQLVPIDEVVAEVEKEYSFVRRNLMAIPSKAAKNLSVLDNPAEIQKELSDMIFETLKGLTKGDPDE